MSKQRNKIAEKRVPATKPPETTASTRLLSGVLLFALAALIGVVLAALESVKAAALS